VEIVEEEHLHLLSKVVHTKTPTDVLLSKHK